MASRPIGSPGRVEKLAARRPPAGRDGSPAWLDLTKEPMIASAPNTNGRYYRMAHVWTQERDEELIRYKAAGLSASKIAGLLLRTRRHAVGPDWALSWRTPSPMTSRPIGSGKTLYAAGVTPVTPEH